MKKMKMNKNNKNSKKQSSNGQAILNRNVSQQQGVPVAMSGVSRPAAPRFGKSTNSIRLHRREFVGTATNGATVSQFMVTALSQNIPGYDFNPSCTSMFPWMSGLAKCYERFRFTSLKFEFVPSNSTTTAGRYYAAVDYDYDDAVALSKQNFMANVTAVEAPIWQSCTMTCDPNALHRDMPYRFVSYTQRGLNVESRTMFGGYLMIGFDTPTSGCLVDIWTEYDIELVTPVLDEDVIQDVPITQSTAVADLTTASGAVYWGPQNITDTFAGNGPVTKVTSGQNGCPNFAVMLGGSLQQLQDGLDIAKMDYKGILRIVSQALVTGTTPASIIGTNLLSSLVALFDSFGTYLGLMSSMPKVLTTIGPATPSELSTNSKYVRFQSDAPLKDFKTYFPTARYLVPYFYSTVGALGAGYQSFGFQSVL